MRQVPCRKFSEGNGLFLQVAVYESLNNIPSALCNSARGAIASILSMPIRILKVQVCDARDDAQGTEAGNKKQNANI